MKFANYQKYQPTHKQALKFIFSDKSTAHLINRHKYIHISDSLINYRNPLSEPIISRCWRLSSNLDISLLSKCKLLPTPHTEWIMRRLLTSQLMTTYKSRRLSQSSLPRDETMLMQRLLLLPIIHIILERQHERKYSAASPHSRRGPSLPPSGRRASHILITFEERHYIRRRNSNARARRRQPSWFTEKGGGV